MRATRYDIDMNNNENVQVGTIVEVKVLVLSPAGEKYITEDYRVTYVEGLTVAGRPAKGRGKEVVLFDYKVK